jgi:hypothetical protein
VARVNYNNIIITSLLNIWYGSYTAHTDYFVTGGKTCNLQEEKPYS